MPIFAGGRAAVAPRLEEIELHGGLQWLAVTPCRDVLCDDADTGGQSITMSMLNRILKCGNAAGVALRLFGRRATNSAPAYNRARSRWRLAHHSLTTLCRERLNRHSPRG